MGLETFNRNQEVAEERFEDMPIARLGELMSGDLQLPVSVLIAIKNEAEARLSRSTVFPEQHQHLEAVAKRAEGMLNPSLAEATYEQLDSMRIQARRDGDIERLREIAQAARSQDRWDESDASLHYLAEQCEADINMVAKHYGVKG